MTKANDAIAELQTAYPEAVIDLIEQWGQTTAIIDVKFLKQALAFLKNDPKAGFEVLIDLTGVDYLHPKKQTKVVYHLHNPATYARVRVAVFVPRDEKIPSVTSLWEGADWYERELFDLFGIFFQDHPDMKRILMPDDWAGHPLRRDYSLTEVPVQFKHDVHPKVPSQIIPYVQFNQR